MKTHYSFLDLMLEAYVECALWSSTGENGQPLDRSFNASQIAPEALRKMELDCLKFYTDNKLADFSNHDLKRAGHDFWLSRNGHGSGFWDGDWPSPQSTILHHSAQKFGSQDLYVGDDGRLYV